MVVVAVVIVFIIVVGVVVVSGVVSFFLFGLVSVLIVVSVICR